MIHVFTGQDVVLYVNAKPVGRVLSVRFNRQRPHRTIRVVDDLLPAEFAPQGTTVSGTIRMYRTRNDGGAEGAGMTVPLQLLSRARDASLMLRDRLADRVIWRCDRARVTSDGWSVATRDLMTGEVQFDGYADLQEIKF